MISKKVISKKDLIVAVLATFCVTSLLFVAIPIRSAPANDGYDPWIDTNDDGIIDYQDLYNLASIYRTSGTPLNKTDLLLELQDRVEALEAPESVNATKLASDAIPHNTTHAIAFMAPITTTSTSWTDMPGMNVEISVSRSSTLLIRLSTEARVDAADIRLDILAWVDDDLAHPCFTFMVPVGVILFSGETNSACYACDFYLEDVAPGTHEVNLQWRISTAGTAYMNRATLTVIALPA